MSHDLAITGVGFRFLPNPVSPTMRLAITLKETWSVARDQSRLGGSVPRLTRKAFGLPPGEKGLHEETKNKERKERATNVPFLRGFIKGICACFRLVLQLLVPQ